MKVGLLGLGMVQSLLQLLYLYFHEIALNKKEIGSKYCVRVTSAIFREQVEMDVEVWLGLSLGRRQNIEH